MICSTSQGLLVRGSKLAVQWNSAHCNLQRSAMFDTWQQTMQHTTYNACRTSWTPWRKVEHSEKEFRTWRRADPGKPRMPGQRSGSSLGRTRLLLSWYPPSLLSQQAGTIRAHAGSGFSFQPRFKAELRWRSPSPCFQFVATWLPSISGVSTVLEHLG